MVGKAKIGKVVVNTWKHRWWEVKCEQDYKIPTEYREKGISRCFKN